MSPEEGHRNTTVAHCIFESPKHQDRGRSCLCRCAASHCHGNHELRHDMLLGVITASEASPLSGVDTDMDVYVYHKL